MDLQVVDEDAPPSIEDQNRYWESVKARESTEDHKLETQFLSRICVHRDQINRLDRRREELRAQLQILDTQRDVEENTAATFVAAYLREKKAVQDQRDEQQRKMKAWFESRTTPRIPAQSAVSEDRPSVGIQDPNTRNNDTRPSSLHSSKRNGTHDGPQNGLSTTPAHRSTEALPGVEIFHGDGHLVGTINRIDSRDESVLKMLQFPVRRRVITRPGRSFDMERLSSIYGYRNEVSTSIDGRPSRWTAVMIQAKGDVVLPKERGCINCSKELGPFKECVAHSGPFWKKCGNCEWSNQPCYMPTGRAQLEQRESTQPSPEESQLSLAKPKPVSQRTRASLTGIGTSEIQDRVAEIVGVQNTPDMTQNTPSSGRKRKTTIRRESARGASGSDGDDESYESVLNPGDLITPDSLVLRHNGEVYTEPECMRGVPVEKITESHSYYDQAWPTNIYTTIKERREMFRELAEASKKKADEDRSVFAGRNRQVNRGGRSLEFLENGPFHPLQLLAKDYMRENIVSFDCLFRLAETHHELSIYHAKGTCLVAPGDWIRQRLHELIVMSEQHENAAGFNIVHAVGGFYSDPKLCHLRRINGKRSIGRPLGYTLKSPPKKRKRPIETAPPAPPSETTSLSTLDPGLPTPSGDEEAQEQEEDEEEKEEDEDQGRPFPTKKAKKKAGRDPDLRYKGFTDTDEQSGTQVYSNDWALSSVRCRLFSSPASLNQYWHHVEEEGLFEHQGYMGIDESTRERIWKIYNPPMSFSFHSTEIERILWAPGTTKVIVRCNDDAHTEEDGQPRGDIIGDFKTERAKRRFIVFCQKLKCQVSKIREADIETAWNSMDPQLMYMVQELPSSEREVPGSESD